MKNIKVKNNINDLIIDSIRPDELQELEELQARYDSRKDFYKKAFTGVYYWSNKHRPALYLKSYDTIVACIFENQLRVYGWYSQTTARHIREFARQNDFDYNLTASDMRNGCVISK